MNDLLFSDQNITPWFLRCSNFPNIPMILIIFLSYTTSIFSKTSVTTVTTLLMIQHQLQHQLLKQAPTALDNKNSSTLCELVLWTLKLNPVHQKHQAFLLSYIPDVLDISGSPRVWDQMYRFLKYKMGNMEGLMNPPNRKVLSDLPNKCLNDVQTSQ